MPTHTDWLEFQKRAQKPHIEALRFHFGAQAEIGRKVQTVVEHEGWQTFLAHLDTVREQAIKKREAKAQEILGGTLVGEALVKAQHAHCDLTGEIRGLTVGMDLVPRLVADGARAVDRLTELDGA